MNEYEKIDRILDVVCAMAALGIVAGCMLLFMCQAGNIGTVNPDRETVEEIR
jgi:hypothetical protein